MPPASNNNYYGSVTTPEIAAAELPNKIATVIAGAKLLRAECNKIRNTALGFGVPIGREMQSSLSHLQIDLAHLEVELMYMTGSTPAQIQAGLDLIANPFEIIHNPGT